MTEFAGTAVGMRTHWCGQLRAEHAGQPVGLCGWVARRREHGEHLAFVDLRDRTGTVQCVVDGGADLRSEYVVRVTGTVRARPEGTVNPTLDTGEVEVKECTVEILATAEPPPFPVDARADDVDEVTRLRYRFVDLRRQRLQRNLAVRATVNSAIRRAMERQGFVEIETPMLVASTPEGSRDFVVPSRLSPGSFYALPQSPQLFKQLCMVGGLDRYYQLARCLRDEDLRADRQFEFTQLDMEASFVGQEEVLGFVSEAVAEATEAVTGQRPADIDRITWRDAVDRYGSDKPDVRFRRELIDLTAVFATTGFNAFKAPCVKGLRMADGAAMTRNQLDGLTADAKRWGAKGLVWMRVEADGTLASPVAKFLSDDELAGVRAGLGAEPGDLCLLVADQWATACHVLGLVRLALGRPPVNEGDLHFLWVMDFPLFESIDEDGRPVPAHHPFTMPHPEDWDLLDGSGEALLLARSQAFDLTVNGWELGSGSVRIHRADLQSRIFALLGISAEEADRRFGFFLTPFRYGAPPHGGFAFGIDRLAAILAGEDNIREVIAFPKPQSGMDPMTGAPTPVDDRQLADLGLRTLPPKA